MEKITSDNSSPKFGKNIGKDFTPVPAHLWNDAVDYVTTALPSSGALVGNLTGNVIGNVTGNATTATTAAKVAYATADLATVAPTNAQMITAFGAAAVGKVGVLFDTDAGNAGAGAVLYKCASTGTGWWYEALTAGV